MSVFVLLVLPYIYSFLSLAHVFAFACRYAPSQIEAAKHIPKPVGMTMQAAARAEEQKRIVSHRGLLSHTDMDALLETCKCTGYSRDVWLKRGRELARSVFMRE